MPITWTKEYDGAAEPDSGGAYNWAKTGTDYVSCAGGIMTYNSVGSGTGYGYYTQAPDVDFNGGCTLEAKVKMVDCESTGFFLVLIRDGTQDEEAKLRLYEDKIMLHTSEYAMNTTNDFHIYRITVSGVTMKVYVDTILRISTTVYSGAVDDSVIFGDDRNATGLNVNAQMDYLNYKLGAAIPPIQGASFLLNFI